jgi:hypothetical protein
VHNKEINGGIMKQEKQALLAWSTGLAVAALSLLFLGLWGYPMYNVWQQQLAGKAEFVRASQNRQIKVEEAKAKLESAEYLNQAEIKRA